MILYITSGFTYASEDEDFSIGQDIDLGRGYAFRKRTGVASAAPVKFFFGIDILLHCMSL